MNYFLRTLDIRTQAISINTTILLRNSSSLAPSIQGIGSMNMKVPPVDLFLPRIISRAATLFGKYGDARDDESKQSDNKSFQFAPRAFLMLQIIL